MAFNDNIDDLGNDLGGGMDNLNPMADDTLGGGMSSMGGSDLTGGFSDLDADMDDDLDDDMMEDDELTDLEDEDDDQLM